MTKPISDFDLKNHSVVPFANGIPPERTPSLAKRLDDIARTLFPVRQRARLPKRRKAVDMLEPRLLLSGDPIAALSGAGTLRVAEVNYDTGTTDSPEQQKELRIQLVQGVNPTGENVVVLSEYRILEVDGTKRVVLNGVDAASNPQTDFITIRGDGGSDHLVIDQSMLSLADILEVNVELGGGTDKITGPEKSEGLVWSLDTIVGGAATGEVSLLQPTGDIDNPTEGDRSVDARVTYEGGRDHFLTFTGIEEFDMAATRDVLVDRTSTGGSVSEWSLSWGTGDVEFARYAAGQAVSATSDSYSNRPTVLSIEGIEAFKGEGNTHLNFSAEDRTAGQAGADINAESGEIRLYSAVDIGRLDPRHSLDVRGVTQFTGTGGQDQARLGQDVSLHMGGGNDVVAGTDDLLEWTINSRSTAGNPEANVTVDYYRQREAPATAEEAEIWERIGTTTSSIWGLDQIVGSDGADRLIFDHYHTGAVAVALSNNADSPELSVNYAAGGAALLARGVESIEATGAGLNTLDYSSWTSSVSVDFTLSTGSGLEAQTGFRGVTTGSDDDEVIMAADTEFADTGAGNDSISLARFSASGVAIDAGTGLDVLIGDQDAQSDVFTDTTVYGEADVAPDDLDAATTGLQTTNPLGSYFEITTLDGNGAAGVFSTRLENGTAQGTTAAFAGIEAFTGQAGSDDADTIALNFGAGSGIVWRVSDVYEGTIAANGATLTYTNIAVARNEIAASANELTLRYDGDGADVSEYVGDVIVDLPTGAASGFKSFTGAVNTLIGSAKNDALTGNTFTKTISGLVGDDFLTTVTVAGVNVIGGAGVNTLGYAAAQGTVTLLNVTLAEGTDTLTHSDMTTAVIIADQSLSAPVTINAAGYTLGGVILQGSGGGDTLTGTAQADTFYASGGADSIVTSGGADTYVARGSYGLPTQAEIDAGDLASNIPIARGVDGVWTITTVATVPEPPTPEITTIDKNGFADTVTGSLAEIGIYGDDGNNVFDASGTSIDVILSGGGGDDILIGGGGNDTLSGGDGTDRFTGNDGTDVVLETGARAYHADASRLQLDDISDTAYTLAASLPVSTAAEDFFRIEITLENGIELTTAALSFDATDGDIETAVRSLRIVAPLALSVTTVRDVDGNVTYITLAFTEAFGGRDLGLAMEITGLATPSVGAAAGAIAVAADATAGTRATGREDLVLIERLELTFQDDLPGWADVSGFGGSVQITGSQLADTVVLGAGHGATLGDGEDFVTVTGLSTLAGAATIDTGLGFDRLSISGLQTVFLTDTQITSGTNGNGINHLGAEEFVILGTTGDDELNASGYVAAGLRNATLISNLNTGLGLPIRSNGNETIRIDADPESDTDPLVEFDTGVRLYDLKAIHGDGTVDYVDFVVTTGTMQDILDGFNAVADLSASIVDGALQIVSVLVRTFGLKVRQSIIPAKMDLLMGRSTFGSIPPCWRR